MNNPVLQFAMNVIGNNPQIKNSPQGREFMDILQKNDSVRGQQMAENLLKTYGVSGGGTGNAQLAIQLGGVTLPETTMISKTVAAGDLNNVSANTGIKNCCGDYDRITVVNTGTLSITIRANSCLFIKRLS